MKIYEPHEETPFTRIIVDITHRCNMSCKNCYLPNREFADMDKYKLYSMLAKLPKKMEIHLQGGEATLRGDLPEIISEILKLGHLPVLLTNGLKLVDIEYVRELKVAGLKHCYVSFNGGTDDKFYEAMDNGKFADKKMLAVQNLNDLGMYVSLGCIVSKSKNEGAIKSTTDFVLKNPGKYYTIRFKTVGQIGRHDNTEQFSQEEFISLVAKELDCYGVTENHIYDWQKKDPDGFDLSFAFPLEPLIPKSLVKIRGGLWIKLPYWGKVGESEVPFDNEDSKGRVTQDFKIAAFFEHVKDNEFNY